MKVAFNRIKITPKDAIGRAMAGYSRPDPCLGILDDVYAYGVLLEDIVLGDIKKKLLLISLDFLKIPLVIADYIREKIQEEFFSLGPGQILIHATHTHSAPDLTGEFFWPGGFMNVIKGIMFGANRNDRYIIWMTMEIVKMVKQLFKDLTPCKIAWTKKKIEKDIVINRRHPMRKSKQDLGVIAFRDLKSNDLIGIIVNFACHPTTLANFNNKMSADYPGRVVHKIHELSDNKVKAIYFNGAAGDINPITTCGTNFKVLEKNRQPIYGQKGTYEHTKKIGYFLGKEALKLAESIPSDDYFENMKFTSYLRTFWVPMKDYKYFSKTWITNKILHLLKKYLAFRIVMVSDEEPNFPGLAIKKRGSKINCYTKIQFIKIIAYSGSKSKEMSIITTPGELFEVYGKRFLNKSPTGKENTFIFQCCNDWIAYLFPFEEYAGQGGYEVEPTFSPKCGSYIEKEVFRLFEELNAGVLFSHS